MSDLISETDDMSSAFKVKRIRIVCATCQQPFFVRASRHRRYCSRKCAGQARAKYYTGTRLSKVCLECGVPFFVPSHRARAKYCSFLCKQRHVANIRVAERAAVRRGKGKQPGGKLKNTTYIKFHGRHLHRVLLEEVLGRSLVPGEVVHHRDGNRQNNDPANLVLTTQSRHVGLHGFGKKEAPSGRLDASL